MCHSRLGLKRSPGAEAVLAGNHDDVTGENRGAVQIEAELIAGMHLVAEHDPAIEQPQLDQKSRAGIGARDGYVGRAGGDEDTLPEEIDRRLPEDPAPVNAFYGTIGVLHSRFPRSSQYAVTRPRVAIAPRFQSLTRAARSRPQSPAEPRSSHRLRAAAAEPPETASLRCARPCTPGGRTRPRPCCRRSAAPPKKPSWRLSAPVPYVAVPIERSHSCSPVLGSKAPTSPPNDAATTRSPNINGAPVMPPARCARHSSATAPTVTCRRRESRRGRVRAAAKVRPLAQRILPTQADCARGRGSRPCQPNWLAPLAASVSAQPDRPLVKRT